jgi:hypothetical protein
VQVHEVLAAGVTAPYNPKRGSAEAATWPDERPATLGAILTNHPNNPQYLHILVELKSLQKHR